MFSVWNNGKGIPVEIHKEEKIYVPHLIFGHCLTGSNYDDDEKKVTGGRNGYGAKLTNIFSTRFIVECQDEHRGKYYKGEWRNNMTVKHSEVITDKQGPSSTCITFFPDLSKFRLEEMSKDMVFFFSIFG